MKVLVDSLGAKIGGAATYALNVFPLMGKLAPSDRFAVYLSEKLAPKLVDPPPNLEIRTAPRAERSALAHLLWQQAALPRIARREGFDVLYSAMSFSPLSCRARRVLLVRNPVYFSALYFRRLRARGARATVLARRALSVASMRTADLVIFPTCAMMRLADRWARLPQRRMRAIHYGFDWSDFDREPEGPVPEMLRRMEEDRGFKILAVSHLCDQKNYATLFRAIGLAARAAPGMRLYVAGWIHDHPWFAGSEEERALGECPEGSVVFLGRLDRGHLRRAYEAASAFAFPSYLESFGHPMVEAMSFGLPVLAADAPVNREVCADAAVYHGPFDAHDLAGKLVMLAGDAAARDDLAAKARERARAFSWEAHVRAVLAVLGR